MIAISRLPYYTFGALLGLFCGYLYAALQVVQYVPGMRWLENWIREQLPQTHGLSQLKDDKSVIAARPRSFAVMDSAALGNALYAMEKPPTAAPVVVPPFQEPDLDPTAPAAAAAAGGQQHGLTVTFREDHTPLMTQHNRLPPAQQQQQQEQQQEVLLNVRDRLASFPIDNTSPTTTATALSLAAGLSPSGNSYDGADVADADVRGARTSGLDVEIGPPFPIEGELDIKYASSSNNIAPNSAAAAPAAATHVDDVQTLLPAAAAAGSGLDTVADAPARMIPSTKKFTVGAPVVGTSDQLGSSPGINHASLRAAPAGTFPAVQRGAVGDSDVVLLTDRAVQELNQQQAELALKGKVPTAGLLNDQGSPRPAFTVGLPAQRQIVTQIPRSRSGSVNGDATPQQQQQLGMAAHPAAGYNRQAVGSSSEAAAAGGGDFAPGTPRSVSSMHSVSSIKTSDSTGTMEKKKKKGLFAALRQKAVKGRQQVR